MSQVSDGLNYTESHEWIRALPDGTFEIGITDHAQEALGDLVFVEVPEPGRTLATGEACAVVESVKAASDVYAPMAGVVVAANSRLANEPGLLNSDPYGEGWLMRLRAPEGAPRPALLSSEAYRAVLAREGG